MFDIYCKVDDETQRIAVHAENAIPRWLAEQDEWRKIGTVSNLDEDLDIQIRNLGYATFTDKSRLSAVLPAKVVNHLPSRGIGLISLALVATAVAAAVLVLTRRPAHDDWNRRFKRHWR